MGQCAKKKATGKTTTQKCKYETTMNAIPKPQGIKWPYMSDVPLKSVYDSNVCILITLSCPLIWCLCTYFVGKLVKTIVYLFIYWLIIVYLLLTSLKTKIEGEVL